MSFVDFEDAETGVLKPILVDGVPSSEPATMDRTHLVDDLSTMSESQPSIGSSRADSGVHSDHILSAVAIDPPLSAVHNNHLLVAPNPGEDDSMSLHLSRVPDLTSRHESICTTSLSAASIHSAAAGEAPDGMESMQTGDGPSIGG